MKKLCLINLETRGEDLRMPTINMLPSANKIKGKGGSSAFIEQVNLVSGKCRINSMTKYLARKARITLGVY